MEQLKLRNQFCFPVYALSRLITKQYQPYLDAIGITYPQYLVLLLLWEYNELSVNEIAQKLILNTNTITPLLQRMESMEIIERTRSKIDERKVMVNLTEKGNQLKQECALIPENLIKNIQSDEISLNDIIEIRNKINTLIQILAIK